VLRARRHYAWGATRVGWTRLWRKGAGPSFIAWSLFLLIC